MRGSRLFSFLFLLFFCAACKPPVHHRITRGFYYWKTIYNATSFERSTLHALNVQRVYLRLFDVDQDPATGNIIPIAPVRIEHADTGFRHVPVVFITQKALQALDSSSSLRIAAGICRMAQALCEGAGFKPAELQIDCDWTSSNKGKYFSLLRQLKQQPWMRGKVLSSTIRLHQVKFRATSGIPPADRGMLMCYSMGDLKKQGPHNSILDAEGAKDYLKHLDAYPLPLDIALPLFEWCVLFRAKQFKGILHDIPVDMVRSCTLFKQQDGNLYVAQRDSMWQGYEFEEGDVVRLERPAYKDVDEIAGYSARRIGNAAMSVVFFDCDSITLKKFSKDGLETIYNRYR